MGNVGKDGYEYRTSRSMKETEKLLKDGWEPVTSSGQDSWFWGNSYKGIMRRQKKTPETVNYSNAIDYSTVDPDDKSLNRSQRRYAKKVAKVAAERAAKKAADEAARPESMPADNADGA